MGEGFTPVTVAALGLAVGSFLNVCIYRLPRRRSIVSPGSRCVRCGAPIRWYDNMPVLSYLWLGGRCRRCGAPIGVTYPLVELATMTVFLLHYWQLGWQPLLLPRLIFGAALVALFVIDLQHQLLPNAITVPGMVAGFAFSLGLPPGWVASLVGILLGGGSLLALAEGYYRVRGEEGLGMGDVKMLAMIGAFLGWQLVLVTLVIGSVLGSVIGVAVLASGRGGLKAALPFGTFLAVGALVASIAGQPLVEWYLSFY